MSYGSSWGIVRDPSSNTTGNLWMRQWPRKELRQPGYIENAGCSSGLHTSSSNQPNAIRIRATQQHLYLRTLDRTVWSGRRENNRRSCYCPHHGVSSPFVCLRGHGDGQTVCRYGGQAGKQEVGEVLKSPTNDAFWEFAQVKRTVFITLRQAPGARGQTPPTRQFAGSVVLLPCPWNLPPSVPRLPAQQVQFPSRKSESWYRENLWVMLNDIFNVDELSYELGEVYSQVSARRKNRKQESTQTKQQVGSKAVGVATLVCELRRSHQHRQKLPAERFGETTAQAPTVLTVISTVLALKRQLPLFTKRIAAYSSPKAAKTR